MELQKIDTRALYQNCKAVSFYFFAILGLLNLITGLLVANQITIKMAWLLNRLFDTPFLFVCYIYFGSLFKLQLDPHSNRVNIWDLVFVSSGTIILLSIQIYDLLLPNTLPQL